MSEPAETPHEGEVRHLPVPVSIPEARPVEAEPAALDRRSLANLPAPVLAAAGGFVVGVATWVLVRVIRRDRRTPVAIRGRRRRQMRGVEVTATRSFLVDVHLLKQR
jgi:hypothetical protein